MPDIVTASHGPEDGMLPRFEIQESEICELEDFQLRWRWLETEYDPLPTDELARIRPLGPEATKRALALCKSWHVESREVPTARHFEPAESLDAPYQNDGSGWLAKRLPTSHVDVVVWPSICPGSSRSTTKKCCSSHAHAPTADAPQRCKSNPCE